jgi:hypothetical protein
MALRDTVSKADYTFQTICVLFQEELGDKDAALFSPDFKRLFGADSVPQADTTYPPAELRAVLRRHLGFPPMW